MISKLLQFFTENQQTITEKQYQIFIDTGYIPDIILEIIANKIISFESLTEYEYTVFVSLTSEIETIISSKNKQNAR